MIHIFHGFVLFSDDTVFNSETVELNMSLRVLSHGWTSGTYDEQLLGVVSTASLDDLNHDLCSVQHGVFSAAASVAGTLTRDTMSAYAIRVSSHLDGMLTQKVADECRQAYNIMLRYHPDIGELDAIYDHLREYYKHSRRPMPLRKSKE